MVSLWRARCWGMPVQSKGKFLAAWSKSISDNDKSWDQTATKDFSGRPALYIFVDMDYFALLSALTWQDRLNKAVSVSVPRGFVTDFASVPRLFWSLVPPIGRYGFAALFHDYAYWQQTTDRKAADRLFRDTMTELKVSPFTCWLLYSSVRLFGGFAWRNNARAKSAGESRLLKMFPDEPMMSWSVWKQKPGVFL